MTNNRYGILSCVMLAALLGACDEAEDDRPSAGPSCVGSKCDNANVDTDGSDDAGEGEAEEWTCPDDDALIELARAEVRKNAPGPAEPSFKAGRVKAFEDLDDDGQPERLVFPGLGNEHENESMVLYLSQGSDCADELVGSFNGIGLQVGADQTQGVRDVIEELLEDECILVANFYEFIDGKYEFAEDHNLEDLCADPW